MVALGVELVRDDAERALLFALARQVFGGIPGWSDRRTLDVLEEDVVLVAYGSGTVAGYVALHEHPPAVVIDQVLVTTDTANEEIGRRLVEYAEGFAIARHAERLEIVVEPDNRPAQELYGGMGFRPRTPRLFELVLTR